MKLHDARCRMVTLAAGASSPSNSWYSWTMVEACVFFQKVLWYPLISYMISIWYPIWDPMPYIYRTYLWNCWINLARNRRSGPRGDPAEVDEFISCHPREWWDDPRCQVDVFWAQINEVLSGNPTCVSHGNPPCFIGKSSTSGLCSKDILDYQRLIPFALT